MWFYDNSLIFYKEWKYTYLFRWSLFCIKEEAISAPQWMLCTVTLHWMLWKRKFLRLDTNLKNEYVPLQTVVALSELNLNRLSRTEQEGGLRSEKDWQTYVRSINTSVRAEARHHITKEWRKRKKQWQVYHPVGSTAEFSTDSDWQDNKGCSACRRQRSTQMQMLNSGIGGIWRLPYQSWVCLSPFLPL